MKIISKIFMLTNIILWNVVGLLLIGVTPLPHTIVVPISTITISDKPNHDGNRDRIRTYKKKKKRSSPILDE